MRRFIAFLLFFPLFICTCSAEALMSSAMNISGTDEMNDALSEDVKKISGKIDNDGMYDAGGALKRLWQDILSRLDKQIQENIESFFSLVVTSLACALCSVLCRDKSAVEYISVAGVCAVALMFMGSVDGMVYETVEALNQIESYSKAAFPAVFTAAAAGGALISSSARYAALCLGLDIIMSTAKKLIIPLIYSFLALSLCKGLFDNPLVKSIQHFIKWLMGIILTAMTICFSAYISITAAISSSADVLAVKTARTVISNALPVVGGMISDAASTVLSAANMIKTSAGTMSLVAVCALCAGPFVKLSVKLFVMKLAASACDMLPGARLSGFINDIAAALSILLGLLGSVSIMLFISFMSVIKVVAG